MEALSKLEENQLLEILVRRLSGPIVEGSLEANLMYCIVSRLKIADFVHSEMERWRTEVEAEATAKEAARSAKELAQFWDYGRGKMMEIADHKILGKWGIGCGTQSPWDGE